MNRENPAALGLGVAVHCHLNFAENLQSCCIQFAAHCLQLQLTATEHQNHASYAALGHAKICCVYLYVVRVRAATRVA